MPTPVSALLHAATLVTAGIFLLLRSSPILSYSSDALLVITLIGSITAFVAGTTALVQNDLKKNNSILYYKSIRIYDDSHRISSMKYCASTYCSSCFFLRLYCFYPRVL